jgi:DNA sulfur modification protein DndB
MNIENVDWDNTEDLGQVVSGLYVDEYRFVAVVPFARLQRLVTDPMLASNPKFRESSAALAEYYALHEEIQRAFDKGKRDNAQNYAEYIARIQTGAPGDTPTIDFYTPQKLPLNSDKNKILWPYELVSVPFDGETQLAARFIAAQKHSATRPMPVIVTITHGKPVEFARQCFHDRNAFQRRASVSVAMAMDTRDPLVSAMRSMEAEVPEIKGKILWQSRQMPQKGKSHIATASFMRTSLACFAHGIGGVQMTKPSLPENMGEEDFTRRAKIWFSRVIEKIGPYMQDRENYVASSPAIWAAVGALGRPVCNSEVMDTETLESIADGLLSKLDGVNWKKDGAWVGIAIKTTNDGGYSFAGGAKDSGTIAFKALTDATDLNYRLIRGMSPAASEAA